MLKAGPLKYLSNFWRTLEIPLINCKINLMLTWSANCVITTLRGSRTFAINHTKLYLLVVTLSTQDKTKLVQQLNSGFKRIVNWNKHQSKVATQAQNQHMNYLIVPSLQGVKRLFVLSFKTNTSRTELAGYYLPTVEIKNYNVMIIGQNV